MVKIRIGTCSWKYDSWIGLVYPDRISFNYLEEYSKKYNTVEIDQWFWSLGQKPAAGLPDINTAAEYAESVDKDFRFSIKVPNSLTLTHHYPKSKTKYPEPNPFFLSPDLYKNFITSISPLEAYLGPLIFQFEYLNKQKMESQILFQNLFADFLDKIQPEEKIAVEIRNPNFLNLDFFSFLKENKIVPVLLQGYYMPPVANILRDFGDILGDTVVIRLHGSDRKGIEKLTGKKWDKIVLSKDEELAEICSRLKNIFSGNVDLYINVNNHYEGSAPLTIKKIESLLT